MDMCISYHEINIHFVSLTLVNEIDLHIRDCLVGWRHNGFFTGYW